MSFNNNELAHIILTWNTFQVKIFTALLNSRIAHLLCEILIVERRTQIARLSCYIIEARVDATSRRAHGAPQATFILMLPKRPNSCRRALRS